jgi:hypothetical protein
MTYKWTDYIREPNFEWVALLPSIQEIPGLYLSLEVDWPIFLDFLSFQVTAGMVPQMGPLQLPSPSFSIHHSLINLSS